MKIDELISELEEIKKEHGNLDVEKHELPAEKENYRKIGAVNYTRDYKKGKIVRLF